MRKVVSYLISSLDGIVSEPQDWSFGRVDDEMIGQLKALIDRQDSVLLGRRTYDIWLPHWPESTFEPFASFINTTPKYVVSTTLDHVTWQNTSLIRDDVPGAVARLKDEPGEDIGVHGSPTLVRHLLQHGLVDELTLAYFPVAVGSGQRLLNGVAPVPMDMVDLRRTGSGIIFATYRPTTPVTDDHDHERERRAAAPGAGASRCGAAPPLASA